MNDNVTDTPTMSSNTAPSGVASAKTEYDSSSLAWKAMDKDAESQLTAALGAFKKTFA
jgi:hypothetical protein